VRRFGTGTPAWSDQTRFLSGVFQGNEYAVFRSLNPVEGIRLQGRRSIVFSQSEARLHGMLPEGRGLKQQDSFWYFEIAASELGGREGVDGVSLAIAVLPDWMSFQAYQGGAGDEISVSE
jgi:hypothetical protein